MEYWNTYKTKIGTLIIVEENKISRIEIVKANNEYPKGEKVETKLIKKAYEQISEYLEGKRKNFTLPLVIKGTKFQEKVWNALLEIPYGETRTYGQIAKQIGNEKASKAVGYNPKLIAKAIYQSGVNKSLVSTQQAASISPGDCFYWRRYQSPNFSIKVLEFIRKIKDG